MKSGSLNLLEPSGPHQACYETPLPYCAFYKAEDCIFITPDIVNSSVISILILCPFSLDHKILMIFFLDF